MRSRFYSSIMAFPSSPEPSSHRLYSRPNDQSKDGEIPHLLFYGPAGSGKKTRVLALLKRIYGPGAERVRLEHRSFKTPSNRLVELTTVASNYHIEMSPGDAGIYDRYIVQAGFRYTSVPCVPIRVTVPRCSLNANCQYYIGAWDDGIGTGGGIRTAYDKRWERHTSLVDVRKRFPS